MGSSLQRDARCRQLYEVLVQRCRRGGNATFTPNVSMLVEGAKVT